MQSPVLATVELSVCLSIHPAVRPLHAGTVSQQHKLGSQNLHWQIVSQKQCNIGPG